MGYKGTSQVGYKGTSQVGYKGTSQVGYKVHHKWASSALMGSLAIGLNMSFFYVFGQNPLPVTQCIWHILIPE